MLSPLKNAMSASGSLATFVSLTILPLVSTMHTLDNFKDTSIPACCSIAALFSRCFGSNHVPSVTSCRGTATSPLVPEQGPLRHLMQQISYRLPTRSEHPQWRDQA